MKRFLPACTLVFLLACDASDTVAPEEPGDSTPVVTISAPADGAVIPLGELVALTGTARDAEGGDLSDAIEWTSDVSGALGQGRRLETDALMLGSQTLTATAEDRNGKSGKSSVKVVVRGDSAPQVTISEPGRNTSVTVGDAVTFVATASDREDGDLTASIQWSSDLDGPLGSGGTIEVSSLSVGRHTVTASATDVVGQTRTDWVRVDVSAAGAPSLTITAPSRDTTVTAGDAVTLQASASDPEDGNLSGSIAWSSDLEGPLGTGASVVTSGLRTGSHVVTATVADASGQSASATVQIQVSQNGMPAVSITSPADGASFTEGDRVTLAATATDPEDGDLSSTVDWTSSLDGSLGTGASLERSSLSTGTHTLTATVSDAVGQEASASVEITVNADGAPVVTITSPSSGASFTAGDPVTMSASATDAEDGDVSASLAWASNVDGALGTGATVQTSGLSLGTHTLSATATDGAGQTGTASVEIRVVQNGVPTVTITDPAQDLSVRIGEDVPLAGTATDPEDGDLSTSIAWSSSLDGALGTGTSLVASGLSQGTHVITASVSDAAGQEGSATVQVVVSEDAAPTVTITEPAGNVSVAPGTDVTLTGSATDPEDGDLSASIAWSSSLDGALGTGPSIVASGLTTGTHVITASASDAAGQQGSATVQVVVSEDTPPTLTITEPSPNSVFAAGNPVTFTGTATDAEDGDLSGSIQWVSDTDGALGTGASLETSSLSLGWHTVTASVTDAAGQTASADVRVRVAQNRVPQVTITEPGQDTTVTVGDAVSFRATASDQEDGDLSAALSWSSSVAGALGTGPAIQVSDLSVGTHTITASVTDAAGQVGEASLQVVVAEDAPPVVTITEPGANTTVSVGSAVTFSGTATDAVDGDLSAALQWTSDVDGALGSGASIQVSGLSLGTHSVTATATDGAGQDGSASVQVTVSEDQPPTVSITTPSQDITVEQGTAVTLEGTASDPEDGNLSGSISWSSNQDGALGSGGSIQVSDLSVGTHVITATVADGAGQEASDTRTIEVTANAAPQVSITAPSQNITVAPGETVTLSATASDAEDGDLSASVGWSSNLDGGLGTGASIQTSALSSGTHTITASVTDSGGQTATATRQVTVETVGLDLWIDAVHLNQANQDYQGSVGGIANRSGLLRVVALASQSNSVSPDVVVRLYQGVSLVLEEIIPAPRTGVPTANQVDLGSGSTTWDLELPANVVAEGLSVVAAFDESGGAVDGNAGNNRFPATGEHSLDVAPLPTMRVRFIPIENTNNGRTGSVSTGNMQAMMDTVRTHLAVSDVEPSVGTVFSTDHDLTTGSGWSALLSDVQALRTAEGATDEYYHGIIPYTGSEAYGGLAYRPGAPGSTFRSAISIDLASYAQEIVAHELGHNLGLSHAPGCGASGADPDFPTSNGLLDEVGWDPNRGTLVAPSSNYDLMSYCNPTFVSANNFGHMVSWRRRDDLAAAPAPSTQGGLLVWGRITPSGVELNPGIPVDAAVRLPSSSGPWAFRLLASDGSSLGSLSFAPVEVPDAPGESHFAFVLPVDAGTVSQVQELVLSGPQGTTRVNQPQAGAPGAAVRSVRAGGGRIQLSWDASQNPVALVRNRSTGAILAFARGGDTVVNLAGGSEADLEVLLPDGRRVRLGGGGDRE